MREVCIDKSVYLVDDESKTYRFLRRNLDWRGLAPARSLENELGLEGYARIFADGRRRVFHYDEAASRRRRRNSIERRGNIRAPKLNKDWHLAHPMPRKPTLDQRIEWHLDHRAHCACRDIPAKLRAEMTARGIRLRVPARQLPNRPALSRDDSDYELFFEGHPDALAAFRSVRAIVDAFGPLGIRTTRSQIAFRRQKGFAYVWMPGRWLSNPGAEAVLSIARHGRLDSPRFKEVVQVVQNVWMHHLEVRSTDEIDDEVREWLRDAYAEAG